MGHNIGGVAVHAATVGLADGSGLVFESRGAKEVKGLDRPIEVYRLASSAGAEA